MDNRDFNPIYASDRTYKEGELAPMRRNKFISPGFFSTMGIPLKAGRDITWPEEYEKRPVVIISENFAREYWDSPANAIGKLIHIGSTDPWHEIIGVAGECTTTASFRTRPVRPIGRYIRTTL